MSITKENSSHASTLFVRSTSLSFFQWTHLYTHCKKAKSPQERLLLIDRLIHAFHWSIRHRRTHAPAAAHLIEGGLAEVMTFLDELTNGEKTTPGLNESGVEWKRTLERVAETFPFVREKMEAKGISQNKTENERDNDR